MLGTASQGLKTLLSFSPSIHPSCLRLSPSLTRLFLSLKFLLGDYPQVSLFPLPACVSSSLPSTDHWAMEGIQRRGAAGGGQQEPGGGERTVVRWQAEVGWKSWGGMRALLLGANTPWRHHKTEQMTLLPLLSGGAREEGGGTQCCLLVKWASSQQHHPRPAHTHPCQNTLFSYGDQIVWHAGDRPKLIAYSRS